MCLLWGTWNWSWNLCIICSFLCITCNIIESVGKLYPEYYGRHIFCLLPFWFCGNSVQFCGNRVAMWQFKAVVVYLQVTEARPLGHRWPSPSPAPLPRATHWSITATGGRDTAHSVKNIKLKPGRAGIPNRCSVARSATCVCVRENKATETVFCCTVIILIFNSVAISAYIWIDRSSLDMYFYV